MDNYSVYILKCSDNSYYTGVTNDIDNRVLEHQNGKDPKAYNYKRIPVELVFCEHFHDINHAIAFEKQIKGWRRAKKKALINGQWDQLPELSKNYSDKNLRSLIVI